MKQFTDLGLAEALLRALTAEGYTTPTPIQSEVIPAMMAGRDVLGIAQTGTGKTASFVLPLLNQIDLDGERAKPKSCRALILAPTRELAAQIADSIRTYGRFTRHSVAVVIGGAKAGPQIRTMARGVDILVATPGRLLDHVSTGAIRLDNTGIVVLDEADQMLDLGFMPAIRRLMAKLPENKQTVLLSATMPKQIRGLAKDFMSNPVEISVAPVARPIDLIDQKVMYVDRSAKRKMLADILSGETIERAIVFTRTKRGADRVCDHLKKANLSAAAIHGDKSQGQRQRALAAFKAMGKTSVTVLVATDIAARGIDVDDVSHVINYELPNVPESYVHRIGRTARAGKSGTAITLCDASETGLLRDIERLIGRTFDVSGELTEEAPAEPVRGGRRQGKPGSGKSRPGKSRLGGASGKPGAKSGRKRNGQAHNGPARDGQARKGQARNAASGKKGGNPAVAKTSRRTGLRPGGARAGA